MIHKIFIWLALSLAITCVCGIVIFGALGMGKAAIASGAVAAFLFFMAQIEMQVLEMQKYSNKFRHDHEPRL